MQTTAATTSLFVLLAGDRDLGRRIEALQSARRAVREAIAAQCPAKPGDTLPAHEGRYGMEQPIYVEAVEYRPAETFQGGNRECWTLRGRRVKKDGKPSAFSQWRLVPMPVEV